MTKRFAHVALAALVAATPLFAGLPDPKLRVNPGKLWVELEVKLETIPKKLKGIEMEIPFDVPAGSDLCLAFEHPDVDARGRVKPTRARIWRQVPGWPPGTLEVVRFVKFKSLRLEDGAYADCATPLYIVGGRHKQVFPVKAGDIIDIKRVKFSRVSPSEPSDPAFLRFSLQGLKLPPELPFPPSDLGFLRVERIGRGSGLMFVAIGVRSDIGYPEPVYVSAACYDAQGGGVCGAFGQVFPANEPFFVEVGLERPPAGETLRGVEVRVQRDSDLRFYATVLLPCEQFDIEVCP